MSNRIPQATYTLVFVVLASLILQPLGATEGEGPLKLGDSASEIAIEGWLQKPEGEAGTLESLKGKVVVLEFWATWCGPCIRAIPHLNELADQFQGRPVQFISITEEESHVVEAFLDKKPIHSWIALDTDDSSSLDYRVRGIPTTVVIDAQGAIQAVTRPKKLTREVLEKVIDGQPAGLPNVQSRRLIREILEEALEGKSAGSPTIQSFEGRSGSIQAGEDPLTARAGVPDPLFQILVRPSSEASPEYPARTTRSASRLTILASDVKSILLNLYPQTAPRTIYEREPPGGDYDVIASAPRGSKDLLESSLRKIFCASVGIRATEERRELEAFVMTVPNELGTGLVRTESESGSSSLSIGNAGVRLEFSGSPMRSILRGLEAHLGAPIVDETGLDEGHYDLELNFANEPEAALEAFKAATGIEVRREKRTIEALVVRPVID